MELLGIALFNFCYCVLIANIHGIYASSIC
jgi:hypothetical protein